MKSLDPFTAAKRRKRMLLITAVCIGLLSTARQLPPSLYPTVDASTQAGQPRPAGSIANDVETQDDLIRQVPLQANDVVYSRSTKMLYASVPSSAGAGGNSIVSI